MAKANSLIEIPDRLFQLPATYAHLDDIIRSDLLVLNGKDYLISLLVVNHKKKVKTEKHLSHKLCMKYNKR